MLLVFGAAFALNFQAQVPPRQQRMPVVRDSVNDSTRADSARGRRFRGRRLAVTAELAASAYKDATAKDLITRARIVRLRQDSVLTAYDATSRERLSVGMGIGHLGHDRLLFRHESVGRVRWQRDVGVWVDMKGRRTGVPMGGKDMKVEIDDETNDPDLNAPIPYYPGVEPLLWIDGGVARAQVDETELVNPIAYGSEAYYTFETGDSISWTIPGQKASRRMQIREIRVRPREPKWNLAVGSLWFDTESGQVVRAAYRLSVPIDIMQVATEDDPRSMDDVPAWVKPMITPMRAQLTSIAVEYGLFEGRFWLPTIRLAEGDGNISFMHVPVKIEQSFSYESVNQPLKLPAITLAGPPRPRVDTMTDAQRTVYRDSVRARVRAHGDSMRLGLIRMAPPRRPQCDTSDTYVTATRRYANDLAIATRLPCDTTKLSHSPDLPASIYDANDELFDEKDIESLKKEALALSAQAPLQLRMSMWPAPSIEYGLSQMRYNRVEGFSPGVSVEQQIGGGYAATAAGRFGFADRKPNLDLTIARTNFTETIGLSAYTHLVSASDWGHPLTFGSSFSALMFGRDEGFYYRASGLSLTGTSDASFSEGTSLEWRLFVENQQTAPVNTTFAVDGANFPPNLVATRGTYTGLSGRIANDYGLDPLGLRISTNFRFEGAVHDSAYGRVALDVTTSHPVGYGLATSLTLAGGTSVGALPPQRLWYLGGSQTVRGQSPDTAQSGNAFWLTRLELGSDDAGFRKTVFGDLGWVGDRNRIREVGRPLSGVGVGTSFLDGLFRFDVARGLYPRKQFRVDLYLESKF